jgi:tetratricopeptide (TPR) repeat protein
MPRNPTAVDSAARTLMAFGRTEDGLALYQQLQSAFPQSPELHVRIGQVYRQLGKLKEAQAAFDRAISANSGYIPAWADRVGVELKLNGFDAAMAIVRNAQKANPDNQDAKFLTGDLLSSEDRYPEAEASYRELMTSSPTPQALGRLFHAVVKEGDLPRGQKLMADWFAKHPDDLNSHLILADAELQAKDYPAAAEQYAMLASKMPRNVMVANNLAWVYDRLKDPRAIDEAKRAYLLAPGEPQVVDTYGYMLVLRGDADGTRLLRQAQNASPNDPQIAFHLARALSDSKDTDGARKLLKPVIDSKAVFDEQEEAKKLYEKLGGS